MKTIQQRLQSRISKRRNFIRAFVEENVADDKASRHAIRVLDLDFDHVCESLSENIIERQEDHQGSWQPIRSWTSNWLASCLA
jgi:hypothetical protein